MVIPSRILSRSKYGSRPPSRSDVVFKVRTVYTVYLCVAFVLKYRLLLSLKYVLSIRTSHFDLLSFLQLLQKWFLLISGLQFPISDTFLSPKIRRYVFTTP